MAGHLRHTQTHDFLIASQGSNPKASSCHNLWDDLAVGFLHHIDDTGRCSRNLPGQRFRKKRMSPKRAWGSGRIFRWRKGCLASADLRTGHHIRPFHRQTDIVKAPSVPARWG